MIELLEVRAVAVVTLKSCFHGGEDEVLLETLELRFYSAWRRTPYWPDWDARLMSQPDKIGGPTYVDVWKRSAVERLADLLNAP